MSPISYSIPLLMWAHWKDMATGVYLVRPGVVYQCRRGHRDGACRGSISHWLPCFWCAHLWACTGLSFSSLFVPSLAPSPLVSRHFTVPIYCRRVYDAYSALAGRIWLIRCRNRRMYRLKRCCASFWFGYCSYRWYVYIVYIRGTCLELEMITCRSASFTQRRFTFFSP